MSWEPTWTLILIAVGIPYFVVLEIIRRGLRTLLDQQGRTELLDFPAVSVVIPCRNEAEHIGAALKDLIAQEYPPDKLQVVVVDDRSEDGTGEIAGQYAEKFFGITVICIADCPEDISPKKHAVLRGMEASDGEIIITTDGDCRFHPGWIKSLISNFSEDTGAVTGLTIFDRDRREPFWQRLQQLDYLSHSFFAAGAIRRGIAFNCNGSNLAIRRAAFEDTNGYGKIRQVITGDDTLLIQRIRHQGKWRIRFTAAAESIVRSWPEETPLDVFHQRLRWGSGGMSYQSTVRWFALSTFAFFFGLLFSPFLWLAGWISSIWIILLGVKWIQEAHVMKAGWKTFRLHPDWLAFILLQIIHIPAIITFSAGGHLWGFRWKGQRFHRKSQPKEKLSEAMN